MHSISKPDILMSLECKGYKNQLKYVKALRIYMLGLAEYEEEKKCQKH